MSDPGFHIPIDHSHCRYVEYRMRDHQHEQPAGNGEDRAEDQPGSYGLLDSWQSLFITVEDRKPN